jgi:uncharacterized protein (DUF58 family)
MVVAARRKRSFWQAIRPKGPRFSFAGSVFALFTGTVVILTVRFGTLYPGLYVTTGFFLFINSLFFIRFRHAHQKSLWDRIMASRFFPRKLSLTNEGKFLVLITLGMGFAAVNTGSNLLYLLLAMLLSLITASGVLSELSLRKVRWTIDFPNRGVANSETLFPIQVTNRKRAFNSFSLDGEIHFAGDPEITQVQPALLRLEPGRFDYLFPAVTFSRRGLYHISSFSIGTGYPFSFFRKSRNFKKAAEVVVVPRGETNVEEVFFAVATGFEEHANRVGRGSEFFSVRPMQPGDEWRDVHWKQSARHNRFTIKEYEALTARRIYVRLVRRSSEPLLDEKGELAIELAASVVKRLALAGFDVGFQSGTLSIAPAAGANAVRHIFTRLAFVDFEEDQGAIPVAPKGRDVCIQVDLDTLAIDIAGVPIASGMQAGGDP